jgi:hypothetical protein
MAYFLQIKFQLKAKAAVKRDEKPAPSGREDNRIA